jgi:hypothetical protein
MFDILPDTLEVIICFLYISITLYQHEITEKRGKSVDASP